MKAWNNVDLNQGEKIGGSKCGPNRPKSDQKLFFTIFSKFASLVFLLIVWGDSLEQCLSSGGKTHKKKLEAQNGTRNYIFAIFSSLHH